MNNIPVWLRWLIIVAVCAIVFAGITIWVILDAGNSFPDEGERILYVSRGQSFAHVADSLEEKGIVRSRRLLMIAARILGGTEKTRVGKYLFTSGVSNREILEMLRTGRGSQKIAVSIPEGIRIRTQARIFARALGIDSSRYAQIASDPSTAHAFGLEGAESLEGYLYPDTYEFSWEQDERDIIRVQVDRMKKFFVDSLLQRARSFGWTMHKTLTFASIVEGEAVLSEERPVIAGVYHNRLKRGMRLEADPTIQYVIPDGPRRLLYADLKLESPYNTYRNTGLPPGPVNNPGPATILASLYPESNRYLFFVANGKGGHWFSRTYGEHQHYVRKYRRNRKK
jgi:UPF0755 protein